jgi:hypothetical protein
VGLDTPFLDNTDVRYADTKLFGTGVVWGIDANNNPTVSDPWNTTTARDQVRLSVFASMVGGS